MSGLKYRQTDSQKEERHTDRQIDNWVLNLIFYQALEIQIDRQSKRGDTDRQIDRYWVMNLIVNEWSEMNPLP